MKATKVTHHKEIRIRVDFSYNSLMTLKLKQIEDAKCRDGACTVSTIYRRGI